MVKSFARWMAKRLHKHQKLQQSLRWYARWGIPNMSLNERVDYAGLLHDSGKTELALDVLSAVLTHAQFPHAYERRAHIYNEMGRDDEAIADLDAAIKLDSEPYIYWYTRAITHNDRGEYELAVRDFTEALRRRKDSKASTYYELGNVYMKLGKFAEAEACYREAASDPSKAIPHHYYRQAQALEQLNRIEEAQSKLALGIKLLDQWRKQSDHGLTQLKARTKYSNAALVSLMKAAQEEYGFRVFEAKLYESQGDLEAAIASLDTAMQTYSNTAELQLRKASLLRQLDQLEEAMELLSELKDNNPRWLPVYMELGTVYRTKGQYEEMIHVLAEAKLHYPDHTVVRFWLADAYREAGQLEQAREENEQLTQIEPNDPLNWRQKAEIAIDEDRYEAADDAYTRAIQLEESPDFYMRRSFSRYMEERYEDAMMDIQSAMKLDESIGKASKTAYALGELYMGMGNWELAEVEYSRSLALEPDNPQIYDRRARCRFAAGRLPDALEDCNRGLLLDIKNARLTWLRGLIQYRLDDHEAALADSLAYVELLPNDSQGHYNLGIIYNHLNRYDEAITSFTKVIELNPFEAQAYLERASIRYHHSFDRVRAADDLAQWLLYAGGEATQGDRFALLNEIRGFDDEMRERAKKQFLLEYGSSQYLS